MPGSDARSDGPRGLESADVVPRPFNDNASPEALSELARLCREMSLKLDVLTGSVSSIEARIHASETAQAASVAPKAKKPPITREILVHSSKVAAARSARVKRYANFASWRQAFSFKAYFKALRREIKLQTASASPVIYTVAPPSAPAARRPRIMHAIPNVHIGGSTQLIVDIMNHLGNDFDMHVMTSSFPPNGVHEGMIIHDFTEPTTSESMQVLFGKFQPDIVHVHYWGDVDTPWYSKVFEAAEKYGVPVIQNINTPVEPFPYKAKSQVVYVSRYVQERFPSVVGVANERVIYPGMDLSRFATRKAMSSDVLDSIGMVYRLENDKLNLAAIDPFIEVALRRPRTRVFIIGGGSLLEPFRAKVRQAGLEENFCFTGYVPYEDLPELYEQFSIFVAPVWKESFGQVSPFAMNMGRAVAGFDIGALSEILQDNSCLADDVEGLADIIVSLLQDPKRLRAIGQRNREICSQRFSTEAMVAAYAATYEEILGLRMASDPLEFFPPAQIFN